MVPVTEINTTSNTGLQCITDRMPCCSTPPNRFGQWYFPNGTAIVPVQGSATSFYRTRGGDGTVTLNRLNTNIMMPTGLFCCEIPDAVNVIQRACATSELETSLCVINLLSFLDTFSCSQHHCRQSSHSNSRTELLPHL